MLNPQKWYGQKKGKNNMSLTELNKISWSQSTILLIFASIENEGKFDHLERPKIINMIKKEESIQFNLILCLN